MATLVVGIAMGASNAWSDTIKEELIEICKQNTLFAVPARPRPSIQGIPVATNETAVKRSRQEIFWTPGSPPLEAHAFTIIAYFGLDKKAPPILDAILERPASVQIQKLGIGACYNEDKEDWKKGGKPSDVPGMLIMPGHQASSNSQKSILFEDRLLFGFPLKLYCFAALPIYSKDPQTHSCILSGVLPDNSRFSLNYDTGNDLPGAWPNISDPIADWAEPLAEVERALTKIAPPTEGGRCD